MSQKTKDSLKVGLNDNYPDNTTGDITPLATRTQNTDQIDSALNLQETLLQTVIGLVNFTGGLQIGGVDVVLPNINFISKEADFPIQDGSSITLETLQWYIITGTGFSTAKKFIAKDRSVWTSSSTLGPLVTYTGTGDMFEIIDASFTIRNARIDHPNAQGYNFVDNPGGTFSFLSDNVRHLSGTKYGTFSNPAIILIQVGAAFDMDDGISVSGANIAINSIDKMGMFSTSATFKAIDLGSSIAQTTEFRDFNASAPAGAFGISGLINSGNIPVGGLAMVTGCTWSGGMTDLENITVKDIRYEFRNNTPTADTVKDALASFNGSSTETVITATNTPVKVNAVWTCIRESFFTCDTTGKIATNSERNITIPIDIVGGLISSGGGAINVTLYLAKNGSIISESATTISISGSNQQLVPLPWQDETITPDDYEVYIENNSNTTNIIVESGKFRFA